MKVKELIEALQHCNPDTEAASISWEETPFAAAKRVADSMDEALEVAGEALRKSSSGAHYWVHRGDEDSRDLGHWPTVESSDEDDEQLSGDEQTVRIVR